MDHFLQEGEPRWSELSTAVEEARGRPERLGAERVLRLGALYRATVADLALARRRFPHDPVRRRLEALVAAARQLIYADEPRRAALIPFLTRGYWQLVRARMGTMALAATLLIGTAVLSALWALDDPGAAVALVPGDFQGAVEPQGDVGMSAAQQAAFSTEVMTNNIQVALFEFAAGILFGIGSAALIVYNALILGVLAGAATEAGNGTDFVEFVAAHGVIELSTIVVAAGAGMRLGWSIVSPGLRTRAESLTTEAREAVLVALGTAPWLVIAGIIEGNVTRAGFGLVPGLILGIAVGGAFWGLVAWRGRPTVAPAASP